MVTISTFIIGIILGALTSYLILRNELKADNKSINETIKNNRAIKRQSKILMQKRNSHVLNVIKHKSINRFGKYEYPITVELDDNNSLNETLFFVKKPKKKEIKKAVQNVVNRYFNQYEQNIEIKTDKI